MSASSIRSPSVQPARPDGPQPGSLSSLDDQRYVADGYRRLLPVDAAVEPHLRGVIDDVLNHPGSLLRARLAFRLMRENGTAPSPARAVAIALEYFHTASLIFDDMPAMDDARARRGRRCPHLVHGEAAATLGALALITRAYALLWQVLATLPAARRRRASELVGACLGLTGILDGQARDLHFTPHQGTPEAVLAVAAGKTVTLIKLTLLLPALVAGVDAGHRRRLDRLATVWGLGYQIIDDFKDCLMSAEETGKSSQRDASLGRPNLPRQHGPFRAFGTLSSLLEEGRSIVAGLADHQGGDRWQALEVLQARLEAERHAIRRRIPRSTRGVDLGVDGGRLPAGRRPVDGSDLAAFIDRQLLPFAGRPLTLVVTVPAPLVAPESLLALAPADDAFLWQPAAGATEVGLGAAHRIALHGRARLAALRRRSAALWRRLAVACHEGCTPFTPRLYGGLAFAPGAADAEPWRGFGDGGFALPRIGYRRAGEVAAASFAIRCEALAARRDRSAVVAAIEALLASLAALEAGPPPALARVRVMVPPPRAGWVASLAAIQRAIADGRCAKVVAAGATRVTLSAACQPGAVLARLSSGVAGLTRYAFRRRGATFVGATPERLVARRGAWVESEALAGTGGPGAAAARHLYACAKERHEHRLVVDAIVEKLGPLCSALAVPPVPGLRDFHTVQHLHTPIAGTLRRPCHVLELVRRLHPTPAVGGTPRAVARRLIRAHEGAGRGWYAAPIGWLDASGDGTFCVALRGGVLRGTEAHVYAGAGIVAGSDAEREYAEMMRKSQPMLRALGAQLPDPP